MPLAIAANTGINPPPDFVFFPFELAENSILALFDRSVVAHPNKISAVGAGTSITFRELDERSNAIAHGILQKLGMGQEPVAFLCRYDIISIIIALGVLKTGRPYTAMDTSFPVERMKQIVNDAQAPLLLTDADMESLAQELIANLPGASLLRMEDIALDRRDRPDVPIDPADPAYILYTSGSTGQPKGVVWSHRQVNANSLCEINEWNVAPSDSFTMFTSLGVGAARSPAYNSLLSGATFYMYDIKSRGMGGIAEWMKKEKITIFRGSQPAFRAVFSELSSETIFPDLRLIAIGGQAVSSDDAALFRAHTRPDCVFANHYAQTECGSMANYYMGHSTKSEETILPVGYAYADKEILLLDDDGKEVAPGEIGEIAAHSMYLSLGYWRQPEMTAKNYLTNPNRPEYRTFHTGDLGRINKEGALVHLGRKDFLVKIRGYRIQLEAVDSALKSVEGIRDAASTAFQATDGPKRLVAYLIAKQEPKPTVLEIRRALAKSLPDYMLPSVYVWMDEFPRTPLGKVDRKQLPEPSGQRPDIGVRYVAPRNDREIGIANIWRDLLRVNEVGMDDNFFELGGDSLLALAMIGKVEKLTGKTIPLNYFENPTIARLTRMGENAQVDTGVGIHAQNSRARQWSEARRNGTSSRPTIAKSSTDKSLRGLEWLIGKWVIQKPYAAGVGWLVWLSKQAFMHKLYRGRITLFRQFLDATAGQIQPGQIEAFMLGNMLSGLRFSADEWDVSVLYQERLRRSNFPFWRSLLQLVEDGEPSQQEQLFGYVGLEFLREARRKGSVILVSFHSLASHISTLGLARQIGANDIPTISQKQARVLYARPDSEQKALADTALYAQTALQAQRLLQQGSIAQFVSDFDYGREGQYRAILAGREYNLKLGFAELALTSGAQVLPKYSKYLPDGKLMTIVRPPFEAGEGSHEERVMSLMRQYEKFLNASWKESPEALRWSRIARHFQQPPAEKL